MAGDRLWDRGTVGHHSGARRAEGIDRNRPVGRVLRQARINVADHRVTFRVGEAQALPMHASSRDVIVSGLVLNFVPDGSAALAEMMRVARPGGTIGFYVWDYPGGGLEFLRAFWTAAAALDASAADLAENVRFPYCTRPSLTQLAEASGLSNIVSAAIETSTTFRDFDDFWMPFTLGAGPAPGYCAKLDTETRARLRDMLDEALPRDTEGAIPLKARAWAVRGNVI